MQALPADTLGPDHDVACALALSLVPAPRSPSPPPLPSRRSRPSSASCARHQELDTQLGITYSLEDAMPETGGTAHPRSPRMDIGPTPRPYAEVIEAWRTSCPRLPVWEEANARGFVERQHRDGVGAFVSVSAARTRAPRASSHGLSAARPPEEEQHARAASRLRMLQHRPAPGFDRRAHLLVRVHLLRGLCRHGAARRLPQLRRRARAAAAPSRAEARQQSRVHHARVEAQGCARGT